MMSVILGVFWNGSFPTSIRVSENSKIMCSVFWICLTLTFNSVFGLSLVIYVVSCPWVRQDTYCTAYITTPEKVVRVSIVIRAGKIVHTDFVHFVERYTVWEYPLSEEMVKSHNGSKMEEKDHVNIFQSTKRFRIVVHTCDRDQKQSDSFVVIPQNNCYKSYFIVTAFGNPFFTVFSFAYMQTSVRMHCPEFDISWDISKLECQDCQDCANGKDIFVTLFEYEAWYFKLDHENVSLLNVQITTDFPVYVVSGNSYFAWSKIKTDSKDITTTSLKPSTTWGKHYIVPNFDFGPRIFAISSLYTPFTVTFQELIQLEQVKKTDLTFQSPQKALHDCGETENIIHVVSEDPFGLYQIFTSGINFPVMVYDVSILNLIPEEQWKRGNIYSDYLHIPGYRMKYVLIALGSQRDVVFPSGSANNTRYLHRASTQQFEGNPYTVLHLSVDKLTGTIYVNQSLGKMIIYIFTTPKVPLAPSLGAYPFDFYQAEIYQENCDVSSKVYAYDGIDNDCDDNVDEEINNGVDDDGDGSVDEDFVEPYSDGQWTQWAHACNESIMNDTIVVLMRSCLDKSIYGRDCDGENTQCNGRPCTSFHSKMRRYKQDKCFCNAGCLTCDRNNFECQGCQKGYETTEHCLTRCKKGWEGYGCRDPIKEALPLSLNNFLIFFQIFSIPLIFGAIYYFWARSSSPALMADASSTTKSTRRSSTKTQPSESVKSKPSPSSSASSASSVQQSI